MKLTKSRKHFLFLLLLSAISWLVIKFHYFANPIPSKIYYSIVFFEFLFVIIGYLFSLRMGRIFLVLGILLLNRITSFAYSGVDTIIIGGFFWGGITGLALRIFLDHSKYSPFVKSVHERFVFARTLERSRFHLAYPGVITFLFVILLGGLLKVYSFPYFNGMDFQESYYLPDLPSRSAFSLSANIITTLLLSMLYFYAEEKSFQDYYKGGFRDFGTGIVISLIFHTIVIFIQTFISIQFFGQSTNSAPDLNRVTGLFRDAGSCTWIYPLILSYSLYYIIKEFNISNFRMIFVLMFLFFIGGGILGLKQGRAYLIILTVSFLLFFIRSLKKFWNRLNKKKFSIVFSIFLLILSLSFVLFIKYSSNGKLYNTLQIVLSTESLIDKFKNSDPNRFFLNKVALKVFVDSPMFGGGVGSVPISLKDPHFPIDNKISIIDGPGSFYTGVLSDVGVLGLILLISWILLQIYYRKNGFNYLFFLVPFIVGYHITHPDGAFMIILFAGPLTRIKKNLGHFSTIVNRIFLLFSVIFLIHILYSKSLDETGPMFRQSKIAKYQLFAYSENRMILESVLFSDGKEDYIKYHLFRGAIIQKNTISGEFSSCAFLSNETSLKQMRLKYTYLDKTKSVLNEEIISLKKFKIDETIHIPIGTEYLKLEEVDNSDKPIFFRGTIFSILADCYNEKNEFRSKIKVQ
ncbi:MAG: O-antigen ligase family protein [Leptospiraceae bacterium]|nr:O-antigen ligase family protein [Leptospiraceae bacterium]MCP5511049.1 O-antigen ligase family protein [Leptospiraceae bacterium]